MVRALMRALAVSATALTLAAAPAAGQQATERYIPIGRSPGLSGEQTWIGTVADPSAAAHDFHVVTPDATRLVRVSEATRIWLDRSSLGLPAVEGELSDCQAGRAVEVRFEAPDSDWADWVKVRPPAPD